MCRHLVYLGPPVTLASLLLDPPHALVRQSYAPREMVPPSLINADGFGVAWYADTRVEPARYRRAQPIWTDASLASLAGVVSSGCVMAAVRSATPGFPVEESGAAPFTRGRWLFSLNGFLADWPRAAVALRDRLPASTAAAIESPSDAALMWAVLLHALDGGAPLVEAVRALWQDAVDAGGGRLNLLATDGEVAVATTYGNSLHTLVRPASTLVASEPLDDDPAWTRVPDRSLVVARAGELVVDNLPSPSAAGDPALTSRSMP
jgi:gamma-glutamyl hercynylcysteine S-oxide hydrolase